MYRGFVILSSFGIFENSKWEKRRVLYLIYRTRL